MRQKTWSMLFVALALVVCLVPSVGMLATGPSPAGANEIPAAAPKLKAVDGSWNADVLTDTADYLSSRFAFRLEAITAWDGLNARLLNTSANDDVILGKDGWLYYADTMDDYLGTASLSDEELLQCARALQGLQETVEARDGRFLFVIAPNKNALYAEHMPTRYQAAESPNDAKRLLALLEEREVPACDLFTAFAQQEQTLYFAWDSHWNGKGAALAADCILSALERDSSYFARSFTAKETHLGDLYQMLYPAGTRLETDLSCSPGLDFAYISAFTAADDITIQTENPSGDGSLLLLRDSFGNSLYPYMADTFQTTYVSRLTDYQKLIEEQPADAVVLELVQRNLNRLLTID